ncbi:MAG: hypothetical protein Q9227_005031 [Pyrenula ochraceoflavens]
MSEPTPQITCLLTGATGGLSRIVLHHLLHTVHIPASAIGVTSSKPTTASQFSNQSLHFRHADFSWPASRLAQSFTNVKNLLFVSTDMHDTTKRIAQHQNVVEAARLAGVGHVWYTSLAFGGHAEERGSEAGWQKAHSETERMLRDAGKKDGGFKYTVLRMGIYADAWPLFVNWYPGKEGVVVAGDGETAFATREELGEGTARLMAAGRSEEYVGRMVLLTGLVAYTLKEMVSFAGEALGKKIGFEVVVEEEYVERNWDGGKDEGGKDKGFFEGMLGYYRAIEKGDAEAVDGELEKILGRRPMDGRDFVLDSMRKTPQYTWHQNYVRND